MYIQNPVGLVVRLTDNVTIPADSGNADYQAFLVWCEAGNTPEPADVPAVDPNAAILAEISKIERDTMVPRVMREFLITMAEREAQREVDALAEVGTVVTAEELLSKNSGYVKAKAMDNHISQLRARLK